MEQLQHPQVTTILFCKAAALMSQRLLWDTYEAMFSAATKKTIFHINPINFIYVVHLQKKQGPSNVWHILLKNT